MYRIIGADGREYGPVSAEQVRLWIAEGRATVQTLVRAEDGTEWKPLVNFPELLPAGVPPAVVPSVPQAQPLALQRQTNGLAVTGLVLGLLGLVGGLCCFGPVLSILGIIFSAQALAQINRRPHQFNGKGLAVAGLVVSIFGVLLYTGLLATIFSKLKPRIRIGGLPI